MTIEIVDCQATTLTITVSLSDPVDAQSAANATYLLQSPIGTVIGADVSAMSAQTGATRCLVVTPVAPLVTGQFFYLKIAGLHLPGVGRGQDPVSLDVNFAGRVGKQGGPNGGIASTVQAVEEAVTYPLLTADVSNMVAGSSGAAGSNGFGSGGGSGSMSQVASKAISSVLRWKSRSDDNVGFLDALKSSFTAETVNGNTQYVFAPRTLAIQTTTGQALSGAQASLYSRAKQALDRFLPVLNSPTGPTSLDPEADPEDIAALTVSAAETWTKAVAEIAFPGGPRLFLVDQYFRLLLGPNADFSDPSKSVTTDPDLVGGILGTLRDLCGFNFKTSPFFNSVDDESRGSDFRAVVESIISFAQSWTANRPFFDPQAKEGQKPFLGTALYSFANVVSSIKDLADEFEFTLDTTLVNQDIRKTLLISFPGVANVGPMYLQDWIEALRSATDDATAAFRVSGRIGLTRVVLPTFTTLRDMAQALRRPSGHARIDKAFQPQRVRIVLERLATQLGELVRLASQQPREPFIVQQDVQRNDQDIVTIQQAVSTLQSRVNQPDPGKLVSVPASLQLRNTEPSRLTIVNVGGSAITRLTPVIAVLDANGDEIQSGPLDPGSPVQLDSNGSFDLEPYESKTLVVSRVRSALPPFRVRLGFQSDQNDPESASVEIRT